MMFLKNLQITLNLDNFTSKNSYLIVILGDFNTKSCNWYKLDTSNIFEHSKIDAIMSQFGLQQLIQEQTHILTDSSFRIGLIFTSQPNLIMESRVHSSLHQNCHHQLINAKINLKIFYPAPYELRYGIINAQMLIKSNEQLSNFLEKNLLET